MTFQASAEAVEIDKMLSVLGLFTQLNSRKLLVSFPHNLSIKPAAGFWARSEFWIRLVGIVFIPFPHATFIEEIPCCYGDTGNAFLSCLPVARWNWGVWSFAVDLRIVTGIWRGFGGLRDGGTGWNLSPLRIMVIWLSVVEGRLDVGVIFDYLRLGIFERGWKNPTHQVSLIPFS